jgi:BMFP domain-containing protein YqiC
MVQMENALHRAGAACLLTSTADLRLAISTPLRYQVGMEKASIDSLAATLLETLPKELGGLKADAEANFRAALAGGLRKMDLVTREEFDVQRAVLERTRAKLEALEERLRSLEASDTT